MNDLIERILNCKRFAVTGASRDPMKFGHRIYFFLKEAGYEVYAVNPNADCLIDGICYPDLASLPVKPDCVVTVTQPSVTAATVKEAISLGIPYLWMQPGSESRDGVQAAEDAGIEVVQDGSCIMVEHRRIAP